MEVIIKNTQNAQIRFCKIVREVDVFEQRKSILEMNEANI